MKNEEKKAPSDFLGAKVLTPMEENAVLGGVDPAEEHHHHDDVVAVPQQL